MNYVQDDKANESINGLRSSQARQAKAIDGARKDHNSPSRVAKNDP